MPCVSVSGWRGWIAYPTIEGRRTRGELHGPRAISNDKFCTWEVRLYDKDAGELLRSGLVEDGEIGGYWYLDGYTACQILDPRNSEGVDVSFLFPRDGASLRRANPRRYPTERFMFVTKSRQACRILREDLRFYRDDLDRIKGTPAPATERPDWWPRMAGRAPPTRFERELEQRGIATRGQFRWWVRYREKNGLKEALSERHGRIFVIKPKFVEWLAGNHETRRQ